MLQRPFHSQCRPDTSFLTRKRHRGSPAVRRLYIIPTPAHRPAPHLAHGETDRQGNIAQYSLAGLFRRGQGVVQDDVRALELYTASAQQDFPYAAYELGKMYRDGIGCEKDAEASEQWYRQAFAGFLELEQQSHDDKLQYRIGWMLLNLSLIHI